MQRPYIIVNCAISADGKTALPTRKQLRISCEEDIKRVHQLRNTCDAILVGIETVLSDNPKLTVNEKYVKNPKQPIRVILDSRCRTPENAMTVDECAKTLVIITKGHKKEFKRNNVEVVEHEADEHGHVKIDSMLNILHQREIKKLLVEGGGTIIWSFLEKKLVDELHVYIAPLIVGGKNTPTMADGYGIKNMNDLIHLEMVSLKKLGPGILVNYKSDS